MVINHLLTRQHLRQREFIIIGFSCIYCTNSRPSLQVWDGVPASLRRSQTTASLGRIPRILHQQLHCFTVSHVASRSHEGSAARLARKKNKRRPIMNCLLWETSVMYAFIVRLSESSSLVKVFQNSDKDKRNLFFLINITFKWLFEMRNPPKISLIICIITDQDLLNA